LSTADSLNAEVAADRAAAGKAARAAAPRSAPADWVPANGRDDPVDVLERQAETRVPELVPIRYGRMLASPFAFYRGAAAVMAGDLASIGRSGFDVQLCGDAHLSNFGAFAAPDRQLVFDVNDFDETLPGPWEWDVMRLAASFAVLGHERRFEPAVRRSLVEAAARAYRETARELSGMRNLDVWYLRLDAEGVRERWEAEVPRGASREFERSLAKTRRKDSMRALAKLTQRVDGELRIVSAPPLIVPIEEAFPGADAADAEGRVRELIDRYAATLPDDRRGLIESYRYVHCARKVVGVGSVGTRAWVVLLIGRDESDPLFLQVKEAQPSVLESYAEPTEYPHQGQRVVEGQRKVQSASDVFIGWLSATDPDGVERDFYVRQLWDSKGSANIETLTPATLSAYAKICGSTLARAHARTGNRFAIGGYLGKAPTFERAMVEFADRYANQNQRDYDALRQAVSQGRVSAEAED
jgi:uncharacterized protein (DUF2252 family)